MHLHYELCIMIMHYKLTISNYDNLYRQLHSPDTWLCDLR